jgi:hypothetical protein
MKFGVDSTPQWIMGKRPQVTVYLDPETKDWLTKYGSTLHTKESEVLRLLVERERRIEWLRWALHQKDPSQPSDSPSLSDPEQVSSLRTDANPSNGTNLNRDTER